MSLFKKVFVCVVVLAICYQPILAQVSAPKYVNEFLSIGVGARALGMSNAQTAITNDATATYWNPAGLLNIEEKHAVSLMHASYFGGIANYDFGAFATKLKDESVLGMSVIRFGVDDIPDTRFLFDADGTLNYNRVQSFSAADYAFLLSYARSFKALPQVRFGANFKVVHRSVGIFADAWGYGLDIGAQAEIKGWQIGAMLRDATGTYNAWSINQETLSGVFVQTGNTLPENSVEVALPSLAADVARRFPLVRTKTTALNDAESEQNPPETLVGVLVSAGFLMTFDGNRNTLISTSATSIAPHLGMEFDYKQLLFLRAGIGNFQQVKQFNGTTSTDFQPNFGLGVRLNNFQIDYALTDIGNQSETLYSHVFSVNIFLNKLLPKPNQANEKN